MLSRLKSSLEKRAPGVVGALRGLRGQTEQPPPAPVRAQTAPQPTPARQAPVQAQPAPAQKPTEPGARPATPSTPTRAVEPTPIPQAPAKPGSAAGHDPVPAAHTEAPGKTSIEAEPAKVEPAKVEPAKAEPTKAEPAKVKAKATAAKVEKSGEKAKHQAADTGSTDIGAYIARAKANGRDPSQIKGTEGINTADDGVLYSGPLDNESSREKAANKLLVIDQFECISCGTCVEQTEKVFYLPIDGKATPIAQDGPMDLIQDAIEACPVTCIHWVTPEEAVERNLTSGVED